MPSIFELVTSQSIVAYWEELAQDREPYLGDELFPARKKLGLKLDWIKGSNGLPVVLKPSAFDAPAVPRERSMRLGLCAGHHRRLSRRS